MSPATRYDVVREPGWPVMPPGAVPNAIVTAIFVSGGSVNANGSENTAWPAGIVTQPAPAKVSAVSLAASIALPEVERATCTAAIVTGPSPNSFDRRRRSCWPPIDVNTTWRRVLFVSPGAGGTLPVSVSCGPVAQVPTHAPAPPLADPPAPSLQVMAAPPPPIEPSPAAPPVPAAPDRLRSPDDQQASPQTDPTTTIRNARAFIGRPSHTARRRAH